MAENIGSPPAEGGLADVDENLTASSTASELTRILNTAGIMPGRGYLSFNARDNDDDDDDEEEAEDFVAVDHDDATDYSYLFRRPSQGRSRTALDELHPFTAVLTVSNVDDCVDVEEAFPEHERASREKVRFFFFSFFFPSSIASYSPNDVLIACDARSLCIVSQNAPN